MARQKKSRALARTRTPYRFPLVGNVARLARMWECKECGQENDDSFPHCMSCGIESDVVSSTIDEPPVPRYKPDLPSNWELTRTVARVISFAGWFVVILGLAAPPLILMATESGRATGGGMLWAILAQIMTISLSGLVLVLIGHVARAIVETTENSGRILGILESECGNSPDRSA